MITDFLTTFCDNTALNTGAAGNYVLGDQIDLGVAARGLGSHPDLYLVATVATTATSGGSATLQLSLLTDDNAAMSSPTVLLSGQTFALASLVRGALLLCVQLPIADNVERFLGIRQTTGTAAFTAGAVDVYLTNTPPARFAYPDALVSGA
jgi:hypothetical protein